MKDGDQDWGCGGDFWHFSCGRMNSDRYVLAKSRNMLTSERNDPPLISFNDAKRKLFSCPILIL